MNLPINQIVCGDNVEVMATFPDACVDSIVTDPPYGLSFMGKRWDYEVPSVECWTECLRVLKPGGYLLAFAGTRTQHRMACRIEDAGFEIRDMIFWCYGSGFPKSLDVGKAIDKAAGAEREVVGVRDDFAARAPKNNFDQFSAINPSERGINSRAFAERMGQITAPATDAAKQWDGWGSALKPALEPITMARKPLDGTIAANVLKHGVGAINVDGCRVAGDMGPDRAEGKPRRTDNTKYGQANETINPQSPLGRFPANLIHDGSDEVLGLFPEGGGGSFQFSGKRDNREYSSNAMNTFNQKQKNAPDNYGDSGSAARFFYCAKADSAERRGSNHPTVKPLDLMRYLVRLVSPIGSIVLDPFAGSGTTLEAAKLESCRFIGIELDAEHVASAKRRLAQGVLF